MKKLKFEEWIIAVLLCIMVIMVAMQVIGRFLFHTSLSYTEELVRYGFVWITFLGAAAAVSGKRHLSIAGGLTFVPKRLKRWITLSVGAGAILFAGVLAVHGVRVVMLQMQTGQTTAALGLPMWIVGLAVPMSAILFIVRVIMNGISGRKGA